MLIGGDMADQEVKIGGPHVEVEIDESKFGKRMQHRGKRVKGVWVVGGVERTEERRMFALSVPDRSADTLKSIIETYVEPGSIVMTDGWGGYRNEDLEELDMAHGVVNHSEHFRDPETGIHTNKIEGTWAGMNQAIHKRSRTEKSIDNRLLEYIWRRKYQGVQWERFLICLRESKYIPNIPYV